MGISRKATEPVGITNAAGEPELVLEVEGLTLEVKPPPERRRPAPDDEDDRGLRL